MHPENVTIENSINSITPNDGTEKLEHPSLPVREVSVKNLYEVVRKPADVSFIKGIVREYLKIEDIGHKAPTLEEYEILYSQLRVDPESIAPVDESARKILNGKAKEDYYSNHKKNPDTPPIRIQPGWYTYQSWELFGGDKINSEEIAHRFYVNSENPMEFCNVLYDKYKEHNIPFYFKTHRDDAGKGLKDSVVVYTSTKLLDENLKIFGEIEEQNPDIILKCNRPHDFVGNMNNWLGYATEPTRPEHSYTSIISKCFTDSMDIVVNDFVKIHPELLVGKEKLSDYYHKYMTMDEYRRKKQHLMRNIPGLFPDFIEDYVNCVRNEMEKNGINPDNICFGDDKKREVESNYGISY